MARKNSRNTKGRIVSAAWKLFYDQGYDNTTVEEIIENLNSPWIEYEDDGSVWVYYLDQKVDITDRFDADGFCYVQLSDNGRPMYMTVKYQEGYATDTNRYPSPRRFRD